MHSEDYKRGLLDMLDVLTTTSNSGKITARYREEYDWRSADGVTPLRIALEYREELENRKALQAAVNLLEENGYMIFTPGDVPKAAMLSNEEMLRILRDNGYIIEYATQPTTPMWTNKNGDRVPFKGTGHEEDESASVIRSATPIERAT